jgi:hypothetical protein
MLGVSWKSMKPEHYSSSHYQIQSFGTDSIGMMGRCGSKAKTPRRKDAKRQRGEEGKRGRGEEGEEKMGSGLAKT